MGAKESVVFQNIVVAVDDSANAQEALMQAIDLGAFVRIRALRCSP
jgi:hypothetical protein